MSSTGAVGALGSGNRKRPHQRKTWCFTLCNPSDTILEQLEQCFKDRAMSYVIGREVGEENGLRHLQGCVRAEKRFRPNELNEGDFKPFGLAHWEGCRNWEASKEYCKKEGNWVSNIKERREVYQIPYSGLRPWQKEMVEQFSEPAEPDDRKIHWFVDTKGGIGKTWFARYACQSMSGLYCGGANRHCCYAMAKALEKEDVPLVIFDVPRSGTVCFQAIENLKNQIFFVGFGTEATGMLMCPPVHIVVFSNRYPELDALSADRWNVVDLCPAEDSGEDLALISE